MDRQIKERKNKDMDRVFWLIWEVKLFNCSHDLIVKHMYACRSVYIQKHIILYVINSLLSM